MKQYRELLMDIMEHGRYKDDRTNTGTIGLFGAQSRYRMMDGFPLVTGKKTSFKNIAVELFWFLSGDTNIKKLHEHDCHIWDEWSDIDGDLGPIYGHQWRRWLDVEGHEHDQITKAVARLLTHPDDRGIIVSAWNVGDLDEMALRPCHTMFQLQSMTATREEREWWAEGRGIIKDGAMPPDEEFDELVPSRVLNLELYQRSADMFLGVPYNIASYSLLLHLIAHKVGMIPGDFVHSFGDVHIYTNHLDQVQKYLSLPTYPLPKLQIKCSPKPLAQYTVEDIEVVDYQHGPFISAPVAV